MDTTTKQTGERAGSHYKATWGTPLQIGDTYQHPHTGQTGRVVRVRDFGTIDLEMPDGVCFRVTGLWWGMVSLELPATPASVPRG